jgi:hypothetical protein
MSIKVFLRVPYVMHGFSGSPVDSFTVDIPYSAYQSHGGEDNAPIGFDDQASLTVPLGTTQAGLYAMIYADILAKCSANSYDTPTKSDIFGFAPASFNQLLPDIPQFA